MLANFVFDVEVVGVSLREFFFHGVHFAERERFLSELTDHLQGEQGPAALVCGLADEGEEALEAASHLGGGLFDAVLDDADFAVGGDAVEADVAADPAGAPGGWAEGWALFDAVGEEEAGVDGGEGADAPVLGSFEEAEGGGFAGRDQAHHGPVCAIDEGVAGAAVEGFEFVAVVALGAEEVGGRGVAGGFAELGGVAGEAVGVLEEPGFGEDAGALGWACVGGGEGEIAVEVHGWRSWGLARFGLGRFGLGRWGLGASQPSYDDAAG